MGFCENLKAIRQSKKWSQQKLADKLQVSRQTINEWENGKKRPEFDSLVWLVDALDVSWNKLMKGEVPRRAEVEEAEEKSDWKKVEPLANVLIGFAKTVDAFAEETFSATKKGNEHDEDPR